MQMEKLNSSNNTIKSMVRLLEDMEGELTLVGMYNLNKAIDYLIEVSFYMDDYLRGSKCKDTIELLDGYEGMGCKEKLFTICEEINNIRKIVEVEKDDKVVDRLLYLAAKWVIREINNQHIQL